MTLCWDNTFSYENFLKPWFYSTCRILTVARALKKITSSFPASKFGRVHHKNLEYCKIKALKQNRNNFNAEICLSKAKDDVRWWRDGLDRMYNKITVSYARVEMPAGTSLNGWGTVIGTYSTGRPFSNEETQEHINVLELKADLFGLASLAQDIHSTYIKGTSIDI